MRLFLSSYRIGNRPYELLGLLRGGRRAAVISNAIDLGYAEPERLQASLAEEAERLESIGLHPEPVDLRQYFDNTAGLRQALTSFDLVWVRGGNTFVLRRAMRRSGFDMLIRELLDKDAVAYGGYSAGVCVLASSLRGLETCDQPGPVPPGYPREPIWDGLGILPYAVVPHYRSDHPESPMMEETVAYYINHHIPFVALRDGEAIIIDEGGMRIVA